MNIYNEIDKDAIARLRKLITRGHIPNGDVSPCGMVYAQTPIRRCMPKKHTGRRSTEAGRSGGVVRVDWFRSQWHPCSDGKTRRIPIEPAFFPLADGLSGRVALLRGIGNAIVPKLAAIFILSAMEADA